MLIDDITPKKMYLLKAHGVSPKLSPIKAVVTRVLTDARVVGVQAVDQKSVSRHGVRSLSTRCPLVRVAKREGPDIWLKLLLWVFHSRIA